MPLVCTEGIVLRMTPYQEYKQIVELFTACSGRISLIFSPKKQKKNCMPPLFGIVEAIYAEGGGINVLRRSFEMTPLSHNLGLRQALYRLEGAYGLVQALRYATPFCSSAPLLYALIKCYMGVMARACDPKAIVASFQLKLLQHEGLWKQMGKSCCQCGVCAKNTTVVCAESYCDIHAPLRAVFFAEEEVSLINTLATIRSLSLLEKLQLSFSCANRIKQIFYDAFQMG